MAGGMRQFPHPSRHDRPGPVHPVEDSPSQLGALQAYSCSPRTLIQSRPVHPTHLPPSAERDPDAPERVSRMSPATGRVLVHRGDHTARVRAGTSWRARRVHRVRSRGEQGQRNLQFGRADLSPRRRRSADAVRTGVARCMLSAVAAALSSACEPDRSRTSKCNPASDNAAMRTAAAAH